jgi:NAD(P)-dependent dehydrogenase (short-subunit alcohol dehydrogenase family)
MEDLAHRLLSLSGGVEVLQTSLGDGVAFDPFPLFDDRLATAEVGIGGRQVVDAVVVALIEQVGGGAVDGLVIATGGSQRSAFEDLSEDNWLENYSYNVLGPVRLIRGLLPALKRLNYIYPLPDGNGRASRLMSHAIAHASGVGAHRPRLPLAACQSGGAHRWCHHDAGRRRPSTSRYRACRRTGLRRQADDLAPAFRTFLPSEESLSWARQVIDLSSAGGAVQLDGAMIARPVLECARRIVALSESFQPRAIG